MPRVNFFYRLLVLSYVLSTFAEGIILPIYAVFVQNIGGTILDAGGAMGIFLITQGIFTIFIHKLHRKASQRIGFMIFGWVVWVIGISLYLFISSTLTLFITQILTAMGNAIADPIFVEELANHTDKKSAELEWGIFEGSNDLVNGFAAILGGIIVTTFGFRVMIYIMITTATLSLLSILYYVRRVRTFKVPATG